MGSGYRGNFGSTRGSKSNIIAASKKESVLTIKTLSSASKDIQNIASKSPINISKKATYNVQSKNGYKQIIYKFNRSNNEYEVRWHTPTPNAPKGIGNTYQITRKKKGIGYGKNATRKEIDHLIKYPSGKIKWVSDGTYQDALRNNKMGKASKIEKEIVKYGHIK